jgi:hypothetical protein
VINSWNLIEKAELEISFKGVIAIITYGGSNEK